VAAENEKDFRNCQRHHVWGTFFQTFGYDLGVRESLGELVMGEKFAQGAQGELFDAHIKFRNPEFNDGTEYALKVFDKGTLLRDFVNTWPPFILHFHFEVMGLGIPRFPRPGSYCCGVLFVVLFEDGRFAFLMAKHHEDLRSLIDRRVLAQGDSGHGPFSKEEAEEIMYRVACGMDWLCKFDIVHRDLKASNVLVRKLAHGGYACYVAEYECSVGVVGTEFWRAPEILQACKERNVSQRPELFTAAADAYSYGMVCYEILTGKFPFEGHARNDYDLVINGQRPELPHYVDERARELLCWCWQADPAARPSSAEITTFLEANSNSPYIRWAVFARDESEWDFIGFKYSMKTWIKPLSAKVKHHFMNPRTSLRLFSQLVLRLLFRAVLSVILLLGCAVLLVILLLAFAVQIQILILVPARIVLDVITLLAIMTFVLYAVLFVILEPARIVLNVINLLVLSIILLCADMLAIMKGLLLGRSFSEMIKETLAEDSFSETIMESFAD
jgi:serine/threonine protein kinase